MYIEILIKQEKEKIEKRKEKQETLKLCAFVALRDKYISP